MKFGKFIRKTTIGIVVVRDSLQGEVADNKFGEEFWKRSAVLYLHPEYAREMGFREGDVVELEKDGRTLRLRVLYSDTAPEEGAMMPNSIFSNFLIGENKKRFAASIAPSDGDVTEVDEIVFSNTN